MQVSVGTSVLGKIAIGPLRLCNKSEIQVSTDSHLTPEKEWSRLETACLEAKEQLEALYRKAQKEVGQENASIFEIHKMLIDDEDYLQAIRNIIETQGTTAEYAVMETRNNFVTMFSAADDCDMQAKSTDIEDISNRIIRVLERTRENEAEQNGLFIVMADDLTPSETVQMDKTKILGFITRFGSLNSHTAILARAMNLPALIDVDFDERWDGKLAVLDGYNQCIYIDPEPDLLATMREKQQKELKQQALLQRLKHMPNITLDGREIQLSADISTVGDAGLALLNDAQGIGLFRSEHIYQNTEDFPSEDQQFVFYKRIAQTMAGKSVVIRTLDMATDEQAPYFKPNQEANPALGCCGLRTSLTQKNIFMQQLKAILRASAFGNVSIMFPMVTSVREIRDSKELLKACQKELQDSGITAGKVQVGIVIETPAAVIIADELAQEVDFFCLDADDLTQYTLALDKKNSKVGIFYDLHHPAILHMIRQTVEAGHRHGLQVGLCGTLGNDSAWVEEFLKMGLDELIVPPTTILSLRKYIRNLDLRESSS